MLNPTSDQTISALIGVIIGYVLKLLSDLSLQNNALKHEKYKIILNIATEYWKEGLELAKNNKGYSYPLELYILTNFYLLDKLESRKVNKKNVTATLKDLDEYKEILSKYYIENIK